MAVDGNAVLAFENFDLGKKSKDFGDFLDARVIIVSCAQIKTNKNYNFISSEKRFLLEEIQ